MGFLPAFFLGSSWPGLTRPSILLRRWMRGSSPRMTIEDVERLLLLRRARPWLLRAAQAFKRLGHREHAEIVKAAADDLHADRESLRVITAVDRHGRILRHVP